MVNWERRIENAPRLHPARDEIVLWQKPSWPFRCSVSVCKSRNSVAFLPLLRRAAVEIVRGGESASEPHSSGKKKPREAVEPTDMPKLRLPEIL